MISTIVSYHKVVALRSSRFLLTRMGRDVCVQITPLRFVNGGCRSIILKAPTDLT